MTMDINEALAFVPPDRDKVEASLGLLRRYFEPETIGLKNLSSDKPTLYVGNHTRFGLIDVPLITREIYLKTGHYPRGLADRAHYQVLGWKDMIGKGGGVVGSREMCRAMMSAGEALMVFPGGAREVMKGKDKNYQLLWENRLGFARLAVESGYSITPFCSVGADEVFDVAVEGETMAHSRLGEFLSGLIKRKDVSGTPMPPIPRGIGLSVIPRPEKFYFAFGEPIETKGYKGKSDDTVVLKRVRKKTATAIEELLAATMLHRAQSGGESSLWRKILQRT